MNNPIDISSFGKGGLAQKTTIRDYRLEVATATAPLPPIYSINFGGKIKNQNGSSSCVSQATSYYAEVLNFKETGQWVELSPKFLYAQCFLPPLGGSFTKDNFALMCDRGIANESDTPSYEQNSVPPREVFMETKSDITSQAYTNALTYLSKSYVTWNSYDLESYKQAIFQGNGCVVIASGNNYCWGSSPIQVPGDPSQLNWRHGIYFIGWNDNTRMFKFINSWGEGWGENGYGYLPYDYVLKGYVVNPMTLIDLPNSTYTGWLSIIANLKEKIAQLLKLKK